MPLFAMGGGDGPFGPFYGLRDPLTVAEVEEIVGQAKGIATEIFVFGERKVEQALASQTLKIAKSGGLLGVEIAKDLLRPRVANTIEGSAIAQQQERERTEREAMHQMRRPKPLRIEDTDP